MTLLTEGQADALTELLGEIIATADIVGQLEGGHTVYSMVLSSDAADTLAAFRAEFEDDEIEEDDDDV